ncbi:MAG: tail fiber domain-containing protein [Cyclobacteriaceae bacterium]
MKHLLATFLLTITGTLLFAQTISVQGVLRDRKERALDDGFYKVTFKIYDTTTDGSALWTDVYSSLELRNGVFQVNLGENTSIATLPFDRTYYVGIAVENNAEMTPRLEMGTFPYALAINGNSNKFPSTGNVIISEDSLKINGGDIVLAQGSLRLQGGDGRIVFNDGTSLNTAEFGGPAASINNPSGTSINADSDTTGTGSIHFQIAGQVKATVDSLGAFRVWDGTSSIDYATATGDVFIENNLEIDGTSYHENIVVANGGYNNNNATAKGDVYIEETLEVDGKLYLTGDMHTSGTIYDNNNSNYFLDPSGTNQLSRLSVGGSNTSDYNVPLYVQNGFADPGVTTAYYNSEAQGSSTWIPYNGQAFQNSSAIFEDDVLCGGSIAVYSTFTSSDSRIKKIKGVSNRQADLDLLNQIKVTDYEMIDQVKFDSRTFKKVIAQEVAAVYPEAVTTRREVIPNIYQSAKKYQFDNNTLSISVEHAHELIAGDKIKLLTNKEEIRETAVLEVIDAQTFTVALDYQPESLFVYGKWIDDFHVVDYEAISMLNVSATQELYKKIQVLEAENAVLKGKVSTLKAEVKEVSALAEKVAAIEKLLQVNIEAGSTIGQNK